ncbi:MAG TPA: quinolinate synthase NadA [Deltaproteobacteria bacterium]|nr:quinolinate synthase NadA [Deltaproteobacteria bacterium]
MNIREEIKELKHARNAIILAHNYQLPEVQDIADFVGDSLGLSIQAAGTDAKTIVFCGVHFMAETAKILSPDKTVLLPDMHSGCPMADMITAADLRGLKKEHAKAKFLCYVNTSASVKAECDLCCTSANAASMVRDLVKKGDRVVFVPDRHLAGYAAGLTGADLVAWHGFCPTHARITAQDILEARGLHPDAVVLAHPECTAEVRAAADRVASTEIMCMYARDMHAGEFIVATEVGIIHRLRKENPDKRFYPACEEAVCPNMKLNTLQKVLAALEDMKHEVTVEREVMHKARKSIRRMLEYRA